MATTLSTIPADITRGAATIPPPTEAAPTARPPRVGFALPRFDALSMTLKRITGAGLFIPLAAFVASLNPKGSSIPTAS